MATTAQNIEVIHAYRHLYRSLLQAVRYSSPARFIARDQLRAAFREKDAGPLDREGVKRTLWFCEAAAKERGLEHKILKNLIAVRVKRLVQVRYWRRALHESRKTDVKEFQENATRHYDMTIAMLNKSMGLLLR